MKKTLLSILSIGLFAAGSTAQTYTPAEGEPLANGEVNALYAGQTINADIPATLNLSGQQLLDALPAAAAGLIGSQIDPNQQFPVTVTSTTLTVVGLPAGLSSDCNGCIVNGGSDRDIVISGTPTAGGNFTIDITSETAGSATLAGFDVDFGGSLTIPVVPFPVPVPALPGIMNSEGYTMNVAGGGNSISEANDVFSLKLYPNPTEGSTNLDVNSREAGIANIEVYSITGALVMSSTKSISVGMNRVAVDLTAVPAGVYLIKADINGAQALIRTQKI